MLCRAMNCDDIIQKIRLNSIKGIPCLSKIIEPYMNQLKMVLTWKYQLYLKNRGSFFVNTSIISIQNQNKSFKTQFKYHIL